MDDEQAAAAAAAWKRHSEEPRDLWIDEREGTAVVADLRAATIHSPTEPPDRDYPNGVDREWVLAWLAGRFLRP